MKRSEVIAYQAETRQQLIASGLALPDALEIEIADFGLDQFPLEGLGLVVRVNEPEYCSKWLTLLPGQECPTHYHKIKKETFFVLSGEVELVVGGEAVALKAGERFTIRPGVRHSFGSPAGAVIEEVSTHDENSDSYFDNPAVVRDPVIEED